MRGENQTFAHEPATTSFFPGAPASAMAVRRKPMTPMLAMA
jgi:hypothetical protein